MSRWNPEPAPTRFWSKVNKNGPVHPVLGTACWLWTAALTSGYGTFAPTREKMVYAHRYSWALANGSIPDGQEVLHRCDVKPCVNDAHLFLGTQTDNMADMDAKGRRRAKKKADSCRNGHGYTWANTILLNDGGRRCRSCQNRSQKLSARRRRAKAAA